MFFVFQNYVTMWHHGPTTDCEVIWIDLSRAINSNACRTVRSSLVGLKVWTQPLFFY